MIVAVALTGLTIWTALAIGWIWLCIGVRRQGWRGLAGAIALQLSFVVFVFDAINGRGLGAILGALVPPLSFVSYAHYEKFWPFVSGILPYSVPVGVMMASPFLTIRNARQWCVAPALLGSLATGLIVGEKISQEAMCREAAAFGVSSLTRNTLLWSLANTPDEFQFEIHAMLKKDGRRYGWSYREMGWYEIPSDAWGEVHGPAFQCPTD